MVKVGMKFGFVIPLLLLMIIFKIIDKPYLQIWGFSEDSEATKAALGFPNWRVHNAKNSGWGFILKLCSHKFSDWEWDSGDHKI